MTMHCTHRTQSNPHTNSQHDKDEGKNESTCNFLESQEHNRVQTPAIAMTEATKVQTNTQRTLFHSPCKAQLTSTLTSTNLLIKHLPPHGLRVRIPSRSVQRGHYCRVASSSACSMQDCHMTNRTQLSKTEQTST